MGNGGQGVQGSATKKGHFRTSFESLNGPMATLADEGKQTRPPGAILQKGLGSFVTV